MDNKEFLKSLQSSLSKPYEVGYCKPPKSTQFKKGVSGNRAGRKKKIVPETINAALELELTNKIAITNEKGRQENVYLYQIIAKQIIQDALKKDGMSRKLILESLSQKNLLNSKEYLEKNAIKKEEDIEHDALVREELYKRLDYLLKEEEEKEKGNNP